MVTTDVVEGKTIKCIYYKIHSYWSELLIRFTDDTVYDPDDLLTKEYYSSRVWLGFITEAERQLYASTHPFFLGKTVPGLE